MSFEHGVVVNQAPTRVVASAQVSAAIPMAFGCAPIHRIAQEDKARAMPGNINLCYDDGEAAQQLGIQSTDDFEKWDLSAMAYTHYTLYNKAPILFVNIFNPDVHFKSVSSESVTFFEGKATLAKSDIIGNLTLSANGTTFVEGTDYSFSRVTGEIIALEGGTLENVTTPVNASYKYAAPELVTADECIGGYDIETGATTGLGLVDMAFPKYSLIPGTLVCPRFSVDVTVAAIMSAKTQDISGCFKCVAFADIPTEGENGVKRYSDVPEYKNKNSLVSENLALFWPTTKFGDRKIPLSVQAASIAALVDSNNGDIPYESPSNKNVQMQRAIANNEELWLDKPKVNYLNANGITTAFNFQGWRLWGNRTAAYPGNTDPKDSFLASRRMFAWYGNRLILTYFQKVDKPINSRFIETIANSEQPFINSLTAAGALLGGSIAALAEENPATQVMDGWIKFRVWLGLVMPAERIEFTLEFDPSYIATLFA